MLGLEAWCPSRVVWSRFRSHVFGFGLELSETETETETEVVAQACEGQERHCSDIINAQQQQN